MYSNHLITMVGYNEIKFAYYNILSRRPKTLHLPTYTLGKTVDTGGGGYALHNRPNSDLCTRFD